MDLGDKEYIDNVLAEAGEILKKATDAEKAVLKIVEIFF